MKIIGTYLMPALAGMTFLFPFASSAESIDDILKAKVLRVAASPDFPPYGLMNKEQKIVGFDTDVAELIAKDLGVTLEQVPAVAPNRIPFLNSKKVDLIIGSLSITPERQKVIDFSVPYGAFSFGIYGPKNISVKVAEDLAGKTIAVQRGTPSEIALDKMAPPSAKIIRFDDTNVQAVAYITGQADLIAAGANVPEVIASKSETARPEMKMLFPALPIGVGIPKGDVKTKERIDAIITARRRSGELDTLYKRWFGYPIPDVK